MLFSDRFSVLIKNCPFSLKQISWAIFLTTLGFSSTGQASAFQLWEESASGTADYHAGGAAEADDAGTTFYNPAGMVRIKHIQASAGGAVIPVDVQFNGTVGGGGLVSAPTSTNGWVQGGTTNTVPNFHLIIPVNDQLFFGLGVTTPFGLSTNYPDSAPIENVATETKLETININPNIAYSFNSHWSIGLGIDAQYAKAIFDETPLGLIQYSNTLSDWAAGWNAGVLYQLDNATRFGISYRSAISHHATGTSVANASGISITSNTLYANMKLPATWIFSAFHQANQRIAVMASANYTQWSSIQTITLNNIANTGFPTSITTPYYYRNTWNFAVGMHIQATQRFMIKIGGGYDQTPTQSQYRDIRLPDVNRWALAGGFAFDFRPNLEMNLGMIHFFTGNAHINNQGAQPAPDYATPTVGTAQMDANVYGFQLTWAPWQTDKNA